LKDLSQIAAAVIARPAREIRTYSGLLLRNGHRLSRNIAAKTSADHL
jgi:hypothetical protein